MLVQVMATGLCRSDWHAWAGHDDDVVFPHVPGHELAGIVVDTGPDVRRWRPGDRVTVPFVCGVAGASSVVPDRPGLPAPDAARLHPLGSFAEYVALHAADVNLVVVPWRRSSSRPQPASAALRDRPSGARPSRPCPAKASGRRSSAPAVSGSAR